MTAYLLTNHLLNLVAPAAALAALMVLFGWLARCFSASKVPMARSFIGQIAIIFIVNVGVLVTGLVVLGHDGKMLTYAAMVLAAAVCQLLMLRAGQR